MRGAIRVGRCTKVVKKMDERKKKGGGQKKIF